MYERDMPRMRDHALASPEGLLDVITFVLLTIQQPLQTVDRAFADVREKGDASVYLFGAKREGYRYAREHAPVLHAAVAKAVEVGDAVGAIDVLMAVPSLGMVKAAFVAQICGLDVACLDQHNLARLGMPYSAVRSAGVKGVRRETRMRKIGAYVKLTRDTGGARYWWDSWCAYVAGRRGSPLKTADAVSAFHCHALGLA